MSKKKKYHFEPVLQITVKADEFIDGEFKRRANWIENIDIDDIMRFNHGSDRPVSTLIQNHRSSLFMLKLKKYLLSIMDESELEEIDFSMWDYDIENGWSNSQPKPKLHKKLI